MFVIFSACIFFNFTKVVIIKIIIKNNTVNFIKYLLGFVVFLCSGIWTIKLNDRRYLKQYFLHYALKNKLTILLNPEVFCLPRQPSCL